MLVWKDVNLDAGARTKAGAASARKSRLSSVSLQLHPGQLTVVLGPNGAGKSSFIKLCAGTLLPSSGSISWQGRDLKSWTSAELAKFRAILSQNLSLPFPLPAEDLVMMGRFPHMKGRSPVPTPRDHAIVASALELCQALSLRARLSEQLSGGELQRIHTARVMAQAWEAQEGLGGLLLLDEPTASLDPQFQHLSLGLAQQLARKGLCVVAVLHDLNLAARYADQIVFLKDARLLAAGPAAAMLDEELLKKVFDVEVRCLKDPQTAHPMIVTLGPMAS